MKSKPSHAYLLRLPSRMWEAVRLAAQLRGLSIRSWIMLAIERALREES